MADIFHCMKCSEFQETIRVLEKKLANKNRLIGLYKELADGIRFKHLKFSANEVDAVFNSANQDTEILRKRLDFFISENCELVKTKEDYLRRIEDLEKKCQFSQDQLTHIEFINKQLVDDYTCDEDKFSELKKKIKILASSLLKIDPDSSIARASLGLPVIKKKKITSKFNNKGSNSENKKSIVENNKSPSSPVSCIISDLGSNVENNKKDSIENSKSPSSSISCILSDSGVSSEKRSIQKDNISLCSPISCTLSDIDSVYDTDEEPDYVFIHGKQNLPPPGIQINVEVDKSPENHIENQTNPIINRIAQNKTEETSTIDFYSNSDNETSKLVCESVVFKEKSTSETDHLDLEICSLKSFDISSSRNSSVNIETSNEDVSLHCKDNTSIFDLPSNNADEELSDCTELGNPTKDIITLSRIDSEGINFSQISQNTSPVCKTKVLTTNDSFSRNEETCFDSNETNLNIRQNSNPETIQSIPKKQPTTDKSQVCSSGLASSKPSLEIEYLNNPPKFKMNFSRISPANTASSDASKVLPSSSSNENIDFLNDDLENNENLMDNVLPGRSKLSSKNNTQRNGNKIVDSSSETNEKNCKSNIEEETYSFNDYKVSAGKVEELNGQLLKKLDSEQISYPGKILPPKYPLNRQSCVNHNCHCKNTEMAHFTWKFNDNSIVEINVPIEKGKDRIGVEIQNVDPDNSKEVNGSAETSGPNLRRKYSITVNLKPEEVTPAFNCCNLCSRLVARNFVKPNDYRSCQLITLKKEHLNESFQEIESCEKWNIWRANEQVSECDRKNDFLSSENKPTCLWSFHSPLVFQKIFSPADINELVFGLQNISLNATPFMEECVNDTSLFQKDDSDSFISVSKKPLFYNPLNLDNPSTIHKLQQGNTTTKQKKNLFVKSSSLQTEIKQSACDPAKFERTSKSTKSSVNSTSNTIINPFQEIRFGKTIQEHASKQVSFLANRHLFKPSNYINETKEASNRNGGILTRESAFCDTTSKLKDGVFSGLQTSKLSSPIKSSQFAASFGSFNRGTVEISDYIVNSERQNNSLTFGASTSQKLQLLKDASLMNSPVVIFGDSRLNKLSGERDDFNQTNHEKIECNASLGTFNRENVYAYDNICNSKIQNNSVTFGYTTPQKSQSLKDGSFSNAPSVIFGDSIQNKVSSESNYLNPTIHKTSEFHTSFGMFNNGNDQVSGSFTNSKLQNNCVTFGGATSQKSKLLKDASLINTPSVMFGDSRQNKFSSDKNYLNDNIQEKSECAASFGTFDRGDVQVSSNSTISKQQNNSVTFACTESQKSQLLEDASLVNTPVIFRDSQQNEVSSERNDSNKTNNEKTPPSICITTDESSACLEKPQTPSGRNIEQNNSSSSSEMNLAANTECTKAEVAIAKESEDKSKKEIIKYIKSKTLDLNKQDDHECRLHDEKSKLSNIEDKVSKSMHEGNKNSRCNISNQNKQIINSKEKMHTNFNNSGAYRKTAKTDQFSKVTAPNTKNKISNVDSKQINPTINEEMQHVGFKRTKEKLSHFKFQKKTTNLKNENSSLQNVENNHTNEAAKYTDLHVLSKNNEITSDDHCISENEEYIAPPKKRRVSHYIKSKAKQITSFSSEKEDRDLHNFNDYEASKNKGFDDLAKGDLVENGNNKYCIQESTDGISSQNEFKIPKENLKQSRRQALKKRKKNEQEDALLKKIFINYVHIEAVSPLSDEIRKLVNSLITYGHGTTEDLTVFKNTLNNDELCLSSDSNDSLDSIHAPNTELNEPDKEAPGKEYVENSEESYLMSSDRSKTAAAVEHLLNSSLSAPAEKNVENSGNVQNIEVPGEENNENSENVEGNHSMSPELSKSAGTIVPFFNSSKEGEENLETSENVEENIPMGPELSELVDTTEHFLNSSPYGKLNTLNSTREQVHDTVTKHCLLEYNNDDSDTEDEINKKCTYESSLNTIQESSLPLYDAAADKDLCNIFTSDITNKDLEHDMIIDELTPESGGVITNSKDDSVDTLFAEEESNNQFKNILSHNEDIGYLKNTIDTIVNEEQSLDTTRDDEIKNCSNFYPNNISTSDSDTSQTEPEIKGQTLNLQQNKEILVMSEHPGNNDDDDHTMTSAQIQSVEDVTYGSKMTNSNGSCQVVLSKKVDMSKMDHKLPVCETKEISTRDNDERGDIGSIIISDNSSYSCLNNFPSEILQSEELSGKAVSIQDNSFKDAVLSSNALQRKQIDNHSISKVNPNRATSKSNTDYVNEIQDGYSIGELLDNNKWNAASEIINPMNSQSNNENEPTISDISPDSNYNSGNDGTINKGRKVTRGNAIENLNPCKRVLRSHSKISNISDSNDTPKANSKISATKKQIKEMLTNGDISPPHSEMNHEISTPNSKISPTKKQTNKKLINSDVSPAHSEINHEITTPNSKIPATKKQINKKLTNSYVSPTCSEINCEISTPNSKISPTKRETKKKLSNSGFSPARSGINRDIPTPNSKIFPTKKDINKKLTNSGVSPTCSEINCDISTPNSKISPTKKYTNKKLSNSDISQARSEINHEITTPNSKISATKKQINKKLTYSSVSPAHSEINHDISTPNSKISPTKNQINKIEKHIDQKVTDSDIPPPHAEINPEISPANSNISPTKKPVNKMITNREISPPDTEIDDEISTQNSKISPIKKQIYNDLQREVNYAISSPTAYDIENSTAPCKSQSSVKTKQSFIEISNSRVKDFTNDNELKNAETSLNSISRKESEILPLIDTSNSAFIAKSKDDMEQAPVNEINYNLCPHSTESNLYKNNETAKDENEEYVSPSKKKRISHFITKNIPSPSFKKINASKANDDIKESTPKRKLPDKSQHIKLTAILNSAEKAQQQDVVKPSPIRLMSFKNDLKVLSESAQSHLEGVSDELSSDQCVDSACETIEPSYRKQITAIEGNSTPNKDVGLGDGNKVNINSTNFSNSIEKHIDSADHNILLNGQKQCDMINTTKCDLQTSNYKENSDEANDDDHQSKAESIVQKCYVKRLPRFSKPPILVKAQKGTNYTQWIKEVVFEKSDNLTNKSTNSNSAIHNVARLVKVNPPMIVRRAVECQGKLIVNDRSVLGSVTTSPSSIKIDSVTDALQDDINKQEHINKDENETSCTHSAKPEEQTLKTEANKPFKIEDIWNSDDEDNDNDAYFFRRSDTKNVKQYMGKKKSLIINTIADTSIANGMVSHDNNVKTLESTSNNEEYKQLTNNFNKIGSTDSCSNINYDVKWHEQHPQGDMKLKLVESSSHPTLDINLSFTDYLNVNLKNVTEKKLMSPVENASTVFKGFYVENLSSSDLPSDSVSNQKEEFPSEIAQELKNTEDKKDSPKKNNPGEKLVDANQQYLTDGNVKKRKSVNSSEHSESDVKRSKSCNLINKNTSIDKGNLINCEDNVFICALKYYSNEVLSNGWEREEDIVLDKKDISDIKHEIMRMNGVGSNHFYQHLKKVVEPLKNSPLIKPKPFAKAVIELLSDDKGKELDEFPQMTKMTKICFSFTISLIGSNLTFLMELLQVLEEHLCAFYDKTLTVHGGINIASYYAALCRCYYLDYKCKQVIYDILYARKMLAYPMIYSILKIWPTVLPLKKNLDQENCLLSETIAFILLYSFNVKSHKAMKQYKISELRHHLNYCYGYSHHDLRRRDDLTGEIISRISEKGSRLALVLLAQCEGYDWAKGLVEKRLFPLMRGWLQGNVDRRVAQEVILTTGMIVRAFPLSKCTSVVKSTIDLLDELFQTSPDENFSETVIECLMFLRRHNLMMITLLLIKWIPKTKTVTKKTLSFVRNILSVKSIAQWVSFYSKQGTH